MDIINNSLIFSPEVYDLYHSSPMSLAVYYATDNGFYTYLLSEGFCSMYEDSEENLKERLNSDDPFVNIPEKDDLMKATLDFARFDKPFNVVFHEYIGNNRRLITVHAIGKHLYTKDGKRYSVVSYDELTDSSRRLLYSKEMEVLSLQTHLIDILSRDYSVVWYIDAKDHSMIMVRDNRTTESAGSRNDDSDETSDYESIICDYVSNYVSAKDQKRVLQEISMESLVRNVKPGELYVVNYEQNNADGTTSFYQFCFAQAIDENEGLHFACGVRDVDILMREEREKQEKLTEAIKNAEIASKAKSSFLFNMSHDIRTPLNAIIGFADLGEKNAGNLEKQADYRRKIKLASMQLLDILNNVLELARIESGKVSAEYDLACVNDLQKTWMSIFEAEIEKKKLGLSVESYFMHEYIYADKTHLTEIVMNIISNAIKYTPEGGAIHISYSELPGEDEQHCIVKTIIVDNGIGMSKTFLKNVFEDFERERNSSISGIQGTGLGLPIAKRLTELMNGTIEIESELGKGTRVILCIPHRIGKRPETSSGNGKRSPDFDFEGKRILLAEDNDLNAEIAIELLADAGFSVDRAEDGVICVDKLKKAGAGYYNLILMDIQMPNMDGYRTAQHIRRLPDSEMADVPIIAMTANAFKEDAIKALEVGMNAHLAKPIDIDELISTLAEILK